MPARTVLLLTIVAVIIVGLVVAWSVLRETSPEHIPQVPAQSGTAVPEVVTHTADTPGVSTTSLSAVGITFSHPASWLPIRVSDATSGLGAGKQVDFQGTGALSFGSRVQLAYGTRDYTPDSEASPLSVLTRLVRDADISQLCRVTSDAPVDALLRHRRGCTITEVAGGSLAEFYSQIDALDGESVTFLVRVLALETGNERFPVAALVLYYAPPVQIATADHDGVNAAFSVLMDKTADASTNDLLAGFDLVAASLSASR